MLKVFIGDNLLKAEKELAIIKLAADPYNYVHLDGENLKPTDLAAHCQIMPFFGGQKTICVRNLLKRFERSSVKEKKSAKSELTLMEKFSEILNNLPSFADVILLDPTASENNSLLKSLKQVQVISCPSPKGTSLTTHIEDSVRQKGGQIERNAAQVLSSLAGGDMLALDLEIDKLILYSHGKIITSSDLAEACSFVKEQNIFVLVDAVIKKDAKTAEKVLWQMLKNGEAPAGITHMLIRSYRIILLILAAKAEGKRGISVKAGVDKALGSTVSPYEYSKLDELSRSYTLDRLKKIHHELLQNDISVKTGQLEAESAVGVLISTLVST